VLFGFVLILILVYFFQLAILFYKEAKKLLKSWRWNIENYLELLIIAFLLSFLLSLSSSFFNTARLITGTGIVKLAKRTTDILSHKQLGGGIPVIVQVDNQKLYGEAYWLIGDTYLIKVDGKILRVSSENPVWYIDP
jgi:hypothetical protein